MPAFIGAPEPDPRARPKPWAIAPDPPADPGEAAVLQELDKRKEERERARITQLMYKAADQELAARESHTYPCKRCDAWTSSTASPTASRLGLCRACYQKGPVARLERQLAQRREEGPPPRPRGAFGAQHAPADDQSAATTEGATR